MIVLVTGGTGFVGRHVVHELRADGRHVRCLVRSRAGAARRLAAWGCQLVEGDASDRPALDAALAGCDAVVHLVAGGEVAAAADAAGVRRLVLVSELGTSAETRGLFPRYAAKWELEQAVRAARLEHVILRPGLVFGRDGGLLPVLLRQVRYLPATFVLGDGKRQVQPLWVEDLARYAAAALDEPAAAGRAFELGGPDRVTWKELYERIERVLGVRRRTVHLPLRLAVANAALLERLPQAPLPRDRLRLLAAVDNVCDMTPALETFGLGVATLDDQIRRAA